jgi:hypothetical protein
MSRVSVAVSGLDIGAAATAAAQALPGRAAIALDEGAQLVAGYARGKVPKRTGRTAASLQARPTADGARIASPVAWYGWLDFGGAVGRQHATVRPYRRAGRYLYPGLTATSDDQLRLAQAALDAAVTGAGFDTD